MTFQMAKKPRMMAAVVQRKNQQSAGDAGEKGGEFPIGLAV
jgi:hypothetical protein